MEFLLVIAPYLLKKQHQFRHNLRSQFFQLEHRHRSSDKQLGPATFNIWSEACFMDNRADSVFVDPIIIRPRFLDQHFIPTKRRARSRLHEPNWPMPLILVTCQPRQQRPPCNCCKILRPLSVPFRSRVFMFYLQQSSISNDNMNLNLREQCQLSLNPLAPAQIATLIEAGQGNQWKKKRLHTKNYRMIKKK